MVSIIITFTGSPITKNDIVNLFYFSSAGWLISTGNLESQILSLLLILAYPILKLNDKLKEKSGSYHKI